MYNLAMGLVQREAVAPRVWPRYDVIEVCHKHFLLNLNLHLKWNTLPQIWSFSEVQPAPFSHHGCLKTTQQLRHGIWSVWISISNSIILPRFFVMISYRRGCTAIPDFFPMSVFPICLWVRLSNGSHSLSLLAHLLLSSNPLILSSPTSFKLTEFDW